METNKPLGLLALFDPQVQHNIVTGIREWVLENEPVIVEAAQVAYGLLWDAAGLAVRAHKAVSTLLAQPQVQDALVAFLEWAPRLEAAAQAAERLVLLHAQAEKGAAAFAANDKATVMAFTREVLKLRPDDATYVWFALVRGDWRTQWDPITFLRQRVWALRKEEQRREIRWLRRNPLQLDRRWKEGSMGLVVLEESVETTRHTLTFEERVEVERLVREGQLSTDAALLLEARLAGVRRDSPEELGWEKRRMERAWRELGRAKDLLKKRLHAGSFGEEPADRLPD